MSSLRTLVSLAGYCTMVFLLAVTLPAVAAPSPPDAAPGAARPVSGAGPASESVERRTPRDTLAGFLDATRRRDYVHAAEYLDLSRIPRDQRAERGPILAHELRIVIDQAVPVDLDELSDEAAGAPQQGLSADRALIGTVSMKTGTTQLLLQRTPGAEDARTWKVAAATVAQIPRLYQELGYGPLADYLPPVFFEVRLLEIALWQWLALIVLVPAAAAVGWIGTLVVARIVGSVVRRAIPAMGGHLLTVMIGPLRLTLSGAAFFLGSGLLNLSIAAHHVVGEAEKALVLVALAWVMVRMTDALGDHATERLRNAGRITATAVVPIGRKATKVMIVALTALAILQNVGLNVTGILAGLGIGGLAVALAAQKTVENLFGGVSLILDQPVRVGDFCRFGDRVGTVEEVGLRSTRIRTLDRTLVSIPNGHFASLELENFTVRDRIWLHQTIGVRYETTPDQLRHLLVGIRRMLYAHPRVDSRPARIRFINFGAYSLDLEIFAYVLTSDYDDFLAIQEDIYLRIMDIVDQSGTGFAFPSQTLYLARDAGLDTAKREAAQTQVAAWRQEGALYLPDFSAEAVRELRGTLEYPPRGSACRRTASAP
ncbi:MAG TPA: mechanosensitive ion channel family protein [Methylomirabilota bacterium]|nr:mechanosensitive ion channel family protein [Methylomirabilota bacterium]